MTQRALLINLFSKYLTNLLNPITTNEFTIQDKTDIDYILNQFNSFHTNTQFTVDDFPCNDIHFLGIQIHPTGTTVYRKSTHTGQYTHISRFTPWSRKVAWIRALVTGAHKIFSNEKFLEYELKQIWKFMSWNGFSRKIAQKLITQKPVTSTELN